MNRKQTYSQRNYKSQQTGFSPVEVLITIAIIAILSAILLPAFAETPENMRQSSNQSEAGQAAVATGQGPWNTTLR
jgi:prepilin-type N-terminal cleavage/methylation domain-containing protein